MRLLVNVAAVAIAFGFAAACGPPQTPDMPSLTFDGAKQIHRQRETVSVRVQPALKPTEFVQIWVRADDNLWYSCGPAKRDSSGAWNAPCQFGSDRHPAKQGARFILGAFYTANRVNAEYLPDSIWYLLKTQQTAPVVFSGGD